MERYPARLSAFLAGLVMVGLIFWPVLLWMQGREYGTRLVVEIALLVALLDYIIIGSAWARKGTRN
ncbi:hypothetical protein SALBM311S_05639 [Streptomyces alboniger]